VYSKLDRQKSLAGGGGGGDKLSGMGGYVCMIQCTAWGGVGLISDGWRSCSELGSFFYSFFFFSGVMLRVIFRDGMSCGQYVPCGRTGGIIIRWFVRDERGIG